MRITASAPGKLVLLGEYAVLEGVPALVLAVNRRARVRLAPAAGGAWQIVSPTLELEARLQIRGNEVAWLAPAPPELEWIATLFRQLPSACALRPCRVDLDTRPFFLEARGHRAKLGLGSSAALTVALLGALNASGNQPPPTLEAAVRVHRAGLGGRGSGIDVAAALTGGLARFELDQKHAPRCEAMRLPNALHWCCVYSGRPTSTAAMLGRVAAWRTHAPTEFARGIRDLATIAAAGIDAVASDNPGGFLSSIQHYADALARFGEAAGVDIVSGEHRTLAALAASHGCSYKSCGAGGGDVGVTFSVDDGGIEEFRSHATRAGFSVIKLEADPRGLEFATTV